MPVLASVRCTCLCPVRGAVGRACRACRSAQVAGCSTSSGVLTVRLRCLISPTLLIIISLRLSLALARREMEDDR